MNKLILLTAIFFTSLAFALPEDAKQPIEIEAESVIVDETQVLMSLVVMLKLEQGSLLMTAELIQVQTNAVGR